MPASVSVITKVPTNQVQATIEAFGPGFRFDVQSDGLGTFTVTATPTAAPAPAPAPASAPAAAVVAFEDVARATALRFVPGAEPDIDYEATIPLPPKSSFNLGLASAGQHRLREILGEPILGGHYDPAGHCKSPDNPTLKNRIVTKNVGPFKATGVDTAVAALADILAQVQQHRPRLFASLGTEGMSCARFTKVNGKVGPGVSIHAWGMAIDFKIGGKTDSQGDNKVMRGSLELAHFFNAAEWFWGAGFPTEDGMHFEASASLVEKWHAQKLI